MLRTARRYDIETDTVIFGNGTPFTKDSLRYGGLQDYVDSMFKFCRGMGALGVDNAEYALLTAICLFSGERCILFCGKPCFMVDTQLSCFELSSPGNVHFQATSR